MAWVYYRQAFTTKLDKENYQFVWTTEKCAGVRGGEYKKGEYGNYNRYLEAWKCQYKAKHFSGWHFNLIISCNRHVVVIPLTLILRRVNTFY